MKYFIMNRQRLRYLGIISLSIVLIGSLASVVLVLLAGRNNTSGLLRILFCGWVLSPFIGLLIANRISAKWHILTRTILSWLMILITLVSLSCYCGILKLPGTKPAFIFLIIPFVSWILIVAEIFISSIISRKLSEEKKPL
jgi:hypothetical protein